MIYEKAGLLRFDRNDNPHRREELSLKDIKARLAGYLLANSSIENGATVFRLKYSKKELSSLLGTIPETLSRALSFLKQKKLITEENNKIIIPDAEKLRDFQGNNVTKIYLKIPFIIGPHSVVIPAKAGSHVSQGCQ